MHQPVAISEFLKDVWYGTVSHAIAFYLRGPCANRSFFLFFAQPLDWARRAGNVVVRNVHDSGGHFAALESPDLLLGDVRAFWGNASLSDVGSFGGRYDG